MLWTIFLVLLASNGDTSSYAINGLPPFRNAVLLENLVWPFNLTFDSAAYTTPTRITHVQMQGKYWFREAWSIPH